jgi:hypothetical protein
MEGSREEGLPVPLRVFEYPCDDPDCFPNLDAFFMYALQGPGETSKPPRWKSYGSTTNTNIVIVHPKLMKLLAGVQRTLQAKYAHLGTPKLLTDCKRQLAHTCVCLWEE